MDLHQKYSPILRFNKDEKFFPMRTEDMLPYSSLHAKGHEKPIVPMGQVTPDKLARYGRNENTYLRTVTRGPSTGRDVVASWGKGALEMVFRWSAAGRFSLSDQLARKAYEWFSPKTKNAATMFWWNGLVSQVLDEQLESAPSGDLPRLILPAESQTSAVSVYQRRSPKPSYYYRQLVDRKYLCLQYWFFYSYNNWGQGFAGMNDHEGDWEGMMLFFRLDDLGRPIEPPAYITYADHESRQTKPWGHEDVTLVGTHPLGYVAAGSHATYPERKTHSLMKLYGLFDYATGDGRTIDHDEWGHRIDLDEVPWLGQFEGSWGTRFWLPIEGARDVLQTALSASPFTALLKLKAPSEMVLPGVSAPHGPVDVNRPQYTNPVAWAGVDEM